MKLSLDSPSIHRLTVRTNWLSLGSHSKGDLRDFLTFALPLPSIDCHSKKHPTICCHFESFHSLNFCKTHCPLTRGGFCGQPGRPIPSSSDHSAGFRFILIAILSVLLCWEMPIRSNGSKCPHWFGDFAPSSYQPEIGSISKGFSYDKFNRKRDPIHHQTC